MAHFETVWNEAESVSKSYTDLSRKEILKQLRAAVEDLADADEREDYQEALGNSLFALCALCAHLEDKKEMSINSHSALVDAIERKRAELLDPERPT